MEQKNNKTLKIVIVLISVIIVLVSGILIYKTLKKEDKDNAKISPLLYEVTKNGSNNKIYLFGSIHLANQEDLSFPNYVLKAYNDSHYLACEFDSVEANKNIEKAQDIALKMLYQDGTTIKDHINQDTYEKLVDFLTKKNSYTPLYDYYKPVFFYSLMSNVMGKDANITSESGIDEYFINKAKDDNKEILEVESMEMQMELLLSFSDNLYETSIKDMIDNYDDGIKEIVDLYDSWKKGDEEALIKLNDEDISIKDDYSEELKKEIENFNKKLINDRNKTMAEKAIEYFDNNQDVFFMVGTLHIIGEDGIANILKENGYIVKRIK